jgi:Na+-translocating ferredoxin:NAD+ oxidoreductase RnfG subunit
VLEYTSDHGYQIANKGWLKQFEKGTSFSVGENIDAISGATISVKSITAGVNEQLRIIQKQ